MEEFAGLIQDKSSVEDFVVWIESVMERCIREVCHLALIVNWLSDKCTISQVELDHTYLTSNLYHTHA